MELSAAGRLKREGRVGALDGRSRARHSGTARDDRDASSPLQDDLRGRYAGKRASIRVVPWNFPPLTLVGGGFLLGKERICGNIL